VTLDAISESTKIQRALLAGLENNDVSRWPSGIYRRSFLREYLVAIGVPPDPAIVEFVRLFPESGASGGMDGPAGGTELRLTLAEGPPERNRRLAWVAGATIDLCVIGLAAGAGWAVASTGWAATALIAITYYATASAFLGASLGIVLVTRAPQMPQRVLRVRPADARKLLHIVVRRHTAVDPVPQPFQPVEPGVEEKPPRLRAASR
jgi:hypothetical protein